MVLTGDEGAEEPALREELATIERAPLRLECAQVVRLADQRLGVHRPDRLLERGPEVPEDVPPLESAVLHLVEFRLHLRGESDVELTRELLDHDLLHRLPGRRREEPALLEFRVVPLRERRDDRGVRRWAADAALLELLHQRRLGVARRRFGEMLCRLDLAHRRVLSRLDRRERLLVLQRARVPFFARLLVEREEPVELHDRPGRPEEVAAQVEIHGGGVEDRRRHLRRHEALPDERVELELLRREELRDALRRARRFRRTDALVRALRRVVLAGGEEARRVGEVRLGELRSQVLARGRGRRVGHPHVVRAHVRDEADGALGLSQLDALVQVLRETHRALRTESELLRGLLLQGARLERRLRILPSLAALEVGDVEVRAPLQVREDLLRRRLVREVRLLAVHMMQLGGEHLLVVLERRGDGPVLARHERPDLPLALDEEPQGDGLDAPRRESLLHRLPEYRTRLVADEAVQHATGLLGVHLVLVDHPRVVERASHRVLRDLEEERALDRRPLRRLDLLLDMPGDRLALAVRVGRDEDRLGRPGGALQFGDRLLLPGDRHILRLESILRVDADALDREIADVADGRLHGVP